jgi:hypothetical protein
MAQNLTDKILIYKRNATNTAYLAFHHLLFLPPNSSITPPPTTTHKSDRRSESET